MYYLPKVLPALSRIFFDGVFAGSNCTPDAPVDDLVMVPPLSPRVELCLTFAPLVAESSEARAGQDGAGCRLGGCWDDRVERHDSVCTRGAKSKV
jgi:hypothetical protein